MPLQMLLWGCLSHPNISDNQWDSGTMKGDEALSISQHMPGRIAVWQMLEKHATKTTSILAHMSCRA